MYTVKMYFVFLFVAIPAATLLSPGVLAENTRIKSSDESSSHIRQKRQLFPFDAERDTTFYLYTQAGQTDPDIIKLNNPSTVLNSRFDKEKRTRFVIHGWTADKNSAVCTDIRDAYFQAGDFNIIIVDWSKGAYSLYTYAKDQVPKVGLVLANFLDFLCGLNVLQLSSVYLVGHSFGAHIAGFAGKFVTNGAINTIFGLDPALPLYYTTPSSDRLNSTDATIVVVMHTNAGVSGFNVPIGQKDFYMNNGVNQNGCLLVDNGCSHLRAYQYFAESLITSDGFIGHKCGDYKQIIQSQTCTPPTTPGPDQTMGGEPSTPGGEGVYYVPTNYFSPYAKGQF